MGIERPRPLMPRVGLLAAVCATFALPYLYRSSLSAKTFVSWDDVENFVENPWLEGGLSWENVRWAFFDGVWLGTYEPVSNIAKMLVVTASGGSIRAAPIYFAAVFLHSVNACLVVLVAESKGADLKRFPILPLLFVMIVFAVHPLRVEVVAWASGFPYTLSTFFSLCACLWQAQKSRKGGVAAALCMLLAVMSKGSSVTVPIVLALDKIGGSLPARSRRNRIFFLERLAWGSAVVFVGFLSAWWGNQKSVSTLSTAQVLCRACIAFWWYPIMHVVALVKASVCNIQYELGAVSHHDLNVDENPTAELLCVMLATLSLVSWSFYRTLGCACQHIAGNTDTSADHDKFAVLVLQYTICILPVLGFVQHGYVSLASDRYSYLPCALVVCPYIVGQLSSSSMSSSSNRHTLLKSLNAPMRRYWVLAFCFAVVGLAVSRTCEQITHWQNTEALTKHALSHISEESSPQGIFILALRGNGLAEAGGQDEQAIQVFERLLAQSSAKTSPLIVSHAHHGIAVAAYRIAKERKDAVWYRRSLEHKPAYPDALFGLANLLQRGGDAEAAIPLYESAIRLEPTATDLRINLGLALRKVGRLAEASAVGRGILKISKGHGKAKMLVDVCEREIMERGGGADRGDF